MLEQTIPNLFGCLNDTHIELNGTIALRDFRNQEKIIEPLTVLQIVTPDKGYDGLSKVTVNKVTSAIDENIVAENIKEGVEILGVKGTFKQGYLLHVSNNTLFFEKGATVKGSELVL